MISMPQISNIKEIGQLFWFHDMLPLQFILMPTHSEKYASVLN